MPATAVATTINQNLPAGGLTQDGVVLDSASNTAAVLAAKGSSTNNFQVIDLSSGTRRVLNNENVQQSIQKTAVVQSVQGVQETAVVQATQAPTDYTRKF